MQPDACVLMTYMCPSATLLPKAYRDRHDADVSRSQTVLNLEFLPLLQYSQSLFFYP